jgi:hypothetical protein
VLPTRRLGAFADVDATLRESLSRLRSSHELPARDRIRGLLMTRSPARCATAVGAARTLRLARAPLRAA